MKPVKYIFMGLVVLCLSVCLHSSVQKSFSADLDEATFSYTDAHSGTYTAKIKNGTGEMSGISKISGTFLSIENGDGTVYFLMDSASTKGSSSFTIHSNQISYLDEEEFSEESDAPTTYTSVTLKVSDGKNKGIYTSKSAKAPKDHKKMSISGSF